MRSPAQTDATRLVASFFAASLAYVLLVLSCLARPALLERADLVSGALASLFGIFGALLARDAFAPGDHQRRVWTTLALVALLLALDNAVRTRWLLACSGRRVFDDPLFGLRTGLIVATNVVQAVGFWLLSRTYRLSGLARGRRAHATAVGVVALLLGAVIAAPPLPGFARQLLEGGVAREAALMSLSSTLGDLTTLTLVVPILASALRLRGGSVAWVFWAISFNGAVWLVYDASDWLANFLPGSTAAWHEIFKVTRFMGFASLGVAGVLQHVALRLPATRVADALAKDHRP